MRSSREESLATELRDMSTNSISISELQQNLKRVMARVERGQVIEVTSAHHQIVRTGDPLIGSSFVMKSRPSAMACAIRMRSNASLCSGGSVANAVT